MLCNCDVGGCAHMVDATLWVGWDGWGGMITFFACARHGRCYALVMLVVCVHWSMLYIAMLGVYIG